MTTQTIACMLVCIMLMTSLSACTITSDIDNPQNLELLGISWNATPEEVKESLKLSDEQIVFDEQIEISGSTSEVWGIDAVDLNVFGEKTLRVQFDFARHPECNQFGLARVWLYYPEDTDMNTLAEKLSKTYGADNKGLGVIRYRINNGTLETYNDKMISFMPNKTISMAKWWVSKATTIEVLPINAQEAIVDAYTHPEFTIPVSREVVQVYLSNVPVATLVCTDSAMDEAYISRNLICFSAIDYVYQLQTYGS